MIKWNYVYEGQILHKYKVLTKQILPLSSL